MSYAGFKTTQKGRDLIAKLLAEKTLNITKVTGGSGTISSEDEIDGLNELISQEMVGTSTVPDYIGDVMTMTLQFRSDMAPGTDFYLREYGVFALDPDVGEILLYYANLGNAPQLLPGSTAKYTGVLDFNIAITIGEDLEGVNLGYPPDAFISKEDLDNHDKDPEAHADLMHPRIQLWVQNSTPTEEGVFLWLDPPKEGDKEAFVYPENE